MSDPTSDRDEATHLMSKKGEILKAGNLPFEPGRLVEVRLKEVAHEHEENTALL